VIDDEPAGFIGFEVTTYGGTGSGGGESETMEGGEAKMESSVLTTVDAGLIGRDVKVEESFIAIEEDIRGFVHAGLGETTDGVKEEVGVDPDFNEVGGVIGVFPMSHLKKKGIDLGKKIFTSIWIHGTLNASLRASDFLFER